MKTFSLSSLPPERIVSAWGRLAVATLAASVVLAVIVLIAPEGAILRRSLVAHANLAGLLWPLAVLGLLASRRLAGEWAGFSLIALGTVALATIADLGLMLSGVGKSSLISFMPIFSLAAHPIMLLAALVMVGLLLAATLLSRRQVSEEFANPGLCWFLLPLATTLLSLLWAWIASAELAGHVRAEVVLWAAGHAWQFALAMLMQWSWLQLAGVSARRQRAWSFAASLPVLGVLAVQASFAIDQEDYLRQLPELLRWALWPVPLVLAVGLLRDGVYRAAGGTFLWLSVGLFALSQLAAVVFPGGAQDSRLWLDAVQHGVGFALAAGLLGVALRRPELVPNPGVASAGRTRAWVVAGGSLTLAVMLFALVPREVSFDSLRDKTFLGSAGTRKHVEGKRAEEIRVRFEQGVAMMQMRQYDFAVQAFHRVLELNPQLPEAHVNMGFALYEKGDFAGAQRFFESATALNKNQVNAYYGLAIAAFAQKNNAVAVGAMRAWLHLVPPDDPFRARGEAKFDEMQKAFFEERQGRGESIPPSLSPVPGNPK
jgi:tetratricopeptide (TPR) repeat protein